MVDLQLEGEEGITPIVENVIKFELWTNQRLKEEGFDSATREHLKRVIRYYQEQRMLWIEFIQA